jgi:hypothetical protein
MRKPMIVAALLLWAGAAVAQHSHGTMKGPNGGPVQDVAGIHAELVLSGNTVTIHILDEKNKPAAAAGISGSVLIVAGGKRETMQLAPSGDSALKGEAKAAIPSGAVVTLVIKTAAGKSGQTKFQ